MSQPVQQRPEHRGSILNPRSQSVEQAAAADNQYQHPARTTDHQTHHRWFVQNLSKLRTFTDMSTTGDFNCSKTHRTQLQKILTIPLKYLTSLDQWRVWSKLQNVLKCSWWFSDSLLSLFYTWFLFQHVWEICATSFLKVHAEMSQAFQTDLGSFFNCKFHNTEVPEMWQ